MDCDFHVDRRDFGLNCRTTRSRHEAWTVMQAETYVGPGAIYEGVDMYMVPHQVNIQVSTR